MGRTQRVSDVTRIAVLAVLAACGLDPSGLGGGRDPGLAFSTTGSTTGANSSGDSTDTVSVTGVATAAEASSTSSASTGVATAAETSSVSTGVATAAEASSVSTGDSAGSTSGEETSSGADAGEQTSELGTTGSTGSSGAECTDLGPLEDLLFVAEAALEGYTLRPSEALEPYAGEEVLYARSDSPEGEPRTITFTFDLPCAASLYWWGLVYTGDAVDPRFDVEWSHDPARESLRWDYGCGGRENGWAWVAIGTSELECIDRHDAVETDTSAWVRLSSPTSSVSLLAALAHSTDAGFDPRSLYTP